VVLTDAEEFGLIGAIAFAGSHPWMKDVRLAINLEGVVKGPLAMWRMGADEGWLMEQLAHSRSKMTVAPYLFSGPPMGNLLAWPVALNAAAFALLVMKRNHRGWWSIPVSTAAVYFSLVLLLPVFYLLYMATGLGTVPVVSFMAVLTVVVIAPHFSLSPALAA
jgi:hypothetical protein